MFVEIFLLIPVLRTMVKLPGQLAARQTFANQSRAAVQHNSFSL